MHARCVALCLALLLGISCLAAAAPALHKIAVLDLEQDAALSPSEAAYLGDGLRAIFAASLPDDRFLVFTRENIFSLLPEGTTLTDCSEDECEIIVGQRLGAEFVVSGQLLRFQGQWRVVLKLHETGNGAFLDARTIKATSLAELEDSLAGPAAELAASLANHAGGRAATTTGVREAGQAVGGQWDWQPEELILLTLESDPPGAAVLVDGELVCKSTPCTVEQPARTVRVAMHAEHRFPREADIVLDGQVSSDTVSWVLEPSVGFLDVTVPDGVIVSVDGREVGYGSQVDLPLKPGNHEIAVRDPRYFPTAEQLWMETGVNYQLALEPQPREGGLVIAATDDQGSPTSARVYLDEVYVGDAPLSRRLIIGRHNLRLEGPDGRAMRPVSVIEAAVDTVRLVLQPLGGEAPLISSPAAYLVPGRFKMGGGGDTEYHRNAYPQHWVTLTRPFLLDRTEVTVAAFAEFIAATGHVTLAEAEGAAYVDEDGHGSPVRTLGAWWREPGRDQGGDWPVTCITFGDALRYANWRSRRDGLTPAYRFATDRVAWVRDADGYRLPTEAEWEFAALCGGACPGGAWDERDAVGSVHAELPNEVGVYGLTNPILEWCWDGYQPYAREPRSDPVGENAEDDRVIRGLGAHRREWASEEYRADRLGFRLARNAPALQDSSLAGTPTTLEEAELHGLLAEQRSVALEVRRRRAESALADSLITDYRLHQEKIQRIGGGVVAFGLITAALGAGVSNTSAVESDDPQVSDSGNERRGEVMIVAGVVSAAVGLMIYAIGSNTELDRESALAEARRIIMRRPPSGEGAALGLAFAF